MECWKGETVMEVTGWALTVSAVYCFERVS